MISLRFGLMKIDVQSPSKRLAWSPGTSPGNARFVHSSSRPRREAISPHMSTLSPSLFPSASMNWLGAAAKSAPMWSPPAFNKASAGSSGWEFATVALPMSTAAMVMRPTSGTFT